jgi:hypothetical protein
MPILRYGCRNVGGYDGATASQCFSSQVDVIDVTGNVWKASYSDNPWAVPRVLVLDFERYVCSGVSHYEMYSNEANA